MQLLRSSSQLVGSCLRKARSTTLLIINIHLCLFSRFIRFVQLCSWLARKCFFDPRRLRPQGELQLGQPGPCPPLLKYHKDLQAIRGGSIAVHLFSTTIRVALSICSFFFLVITCCEWICVQKGRLLRSCCKINAAKSWCHPVFSTPNDKLERL